MPRKSTGAYPLNWAEISRAVKDEAEWKCVRCGHPHDRESGHVLTVHHLDGHKDNCAWYNLAALCQKCHLRIQAKVIMEREWMFEHSTWFLPYVAAYPIFFDEDTEFDDEPCPRCGHAPTLARRCDVLGCDDGWIDRYDEDPGWYDEDDPELCTECWGTGWQRWCPKCGFNLQRPRPAPEQSVGGAGEE